MKCRINDISRTLDRFVWSSIIFSLRIDGIKSLMQNSTDLFVTATIEETVEEYNDAKNE